jgi:D-3-phosphoglycerate dehydrogenase
MKIYVLDSFYPAGVEYAAQRAEVIRWDDPRAENWHEDADGLMVRVKQISADDIARAKKLRVISKQGVGLDNIDLAAARPAASRSAGHPVSTRKLSPKWR